MHIKIFSRGITRVILIYREWKKLVLRRIFAIYVPSPEAEVDSSDKPIRYDDMEKDEYSLPLPDLIGSDQALPIVIERYLFCLELKNTLKGKVKSAFLDMNWKIAFKKETFCCYAY